MRHFAARRFGLEFSLGVICALSACAAERTPPAGTPAATAVNAVANRRCELFLCPSNFVPVPGLGSAGSSVIAGGHSVWALDDRAAIYRLNANARQFDPVPGSLAWVSVGGGDLVSSDRVWGGTSDYHIFVWSLALAQWWEVANPPGDLIRFVAAGRGHNVDGCHLKEVWGISVANHLFRRNDCTDAWEQIQGPPLVTLAVGGGQAGGGEVWGLDATGQVFRFDAAAVPVSFQQVPGTLTRLAVGVDGVWGILDPTPVDTGGATIARIGVGVSLAPQVFQYDADAATPAFVQIPNAEMKDIAAGGNGVWALDQSGHVFRLQAVTRKFIPVPSVPLLSLTVGSGTDVWGIDRQHQIRAFVTPARIIGSTNAPP
jgi:hypothetical protein